MKNILLKIKNLSNSSFEINEICDYVKRTPIEILSQNEVSILEDASHILRNNDRDEESFLLICALYAKTNDERLVIYIHNHSNLTFPSIMKKQFQNIKYIR